MSKQQSMDVLTEVYNEVKNGVEDAEVVVFIKQGDTITHTSTQLKDAMGFVAAMELAKFTTLQRLKS